MVEDLGNPSVHPPMEGKTPIPSLVPFKGSKGEDVDQWIRSLSRTARLHQLAERTTYLWVVAALKGAAEEWFNLQVDLGHLQEEGDSCDELFARLRKRFGAKNTTPKACGNRWTSFGNYTTRR